MRLWTWYNRSMPSPIHDPTLAPDLLDYIAAQVAVSPAKRTPALKDFLCKAGQWNLPTSSAVDECINNSSAASLTLRRRLIDAMLEHNTNLHTLYTPVLLAWGFSQSWALDIDTEGVMNRWVTENVMETDYSCDAACYNTAAFAAQMLPLKNALPAGWRSQVFADATWSMLQAVNTWHADRVANHKFGDAVVGMGLLANICAEKERESQTLPQFWLTTARRLLAQTKFQTTMGLSRTIAKSTLPGQDKLAVHEGSHPVLWSMSKETFLPLLPENETERFACLPFTRPDKDPSEMEEWEKEGYISYNSNVVRHFCPTLHPLLSLAVSPADWCMRERIQTWVEQFNNRDLAQSIPLPDLDAGESPTPPPP